MSATGEQYGGDEESLVCGSKSGTAAVPWSGDKSTKPTHTWIPCMVEIGFTQHVLPSFADDGCDEGCNESLYSADVEHDTTHPGGKQYLI
jgi:hypothetical protein